MSFDDFRFDPAIVSGIQAVGWQEPTAIQTQAIPPILKRRDLIGLAQTGTGKTGAFVLPVLQRLVSEDRGSVRAAVICPTRELAEQTCRVFNELGERAGLRCVAVYGGVSMDQQVRALRDGVEVVVGCPGRMLDHLWRGTLDFTRLQVLIIDEADRMLDMGFLPSMRFVLECILQPRQTLLFSATMPEAIRDLAREILHDPITVKVGQTRPADTVSHVLYPVDERLKTPLLEQVLLKIDAGSVLVFTRTKSRAQRVAQQLRDAGFQARSLHGDMTQPERQAVFDRFRDGSFRILVATDIAARGIDVLRISHVINYDMPDDADAYIHRIGRTGRIDHEGEALTLVTPRDDQAIRDLERLMNRQIERHKLEGFDYRSPRGASPGRSTQGRRRSRRPPVSGRSTSG